MIPSIAVIRSGGKGFFDRKICGLYPIERNIRIFYQAGVSKIILFLSGPELAFYEARVAPKVASLKDLEIAVNPKKAPSGKRFDISANTFLQYHQVLRFEKDMKQQDGAWSTGGKSFIVLKSEKDFVRAEKAAIEHIRRSAGGVIAQNINKRISLPISRILVRTGIHPNVLTFFNMMLMLCGAALLFVDSYWTLFASGLIFQLVSIFDGCDGEVAKLTLRFSKFGSWFDTFCDYLALFLYLAGFTVLFARHSPLWLSILCGVFALGGALVMVASILYYLHTYSVSGSFVAYGRDFTDKLPKSDPVIRFIRVGQYFTRKECYSWIVFFFGLFGILNYILILGAVICFVGAVLLIIINVRYFPTLPKKKQTAEMVYISRRGN
ncbi:MAG: CDP-alcohol phosphatidyltransferase family protein [Spirochaetota bacterium]